MKNLLLFATMLMSAVTYSQVYQTYEMYFVEIEGDLDAFEEYQTHMQKAAQHAVDKEKIAFWAFLKRISFDRINDEKRFNYLFVQSNTDIKALLSDDHKWWTRNDSFFSEKDKEKLQALRQRFERVSDHKKIMVDETSIALGLGTHIQFNFAKPNDINVFLDESKSTWKPFFEEYMPQMGMLNWGVGRVLAPLAGNQPTVGTWDMFDSLENLMEYRNGHPLSDDLIAKMETNQLTKVNWWTQMIFEAKLFAVSE